MLEKEKQTKKEEGSPASKKNKTMRTEIPKIPIGSHDDNRKRSLDKKEKKQSEDSPRKSKEKHDRSKERRSKSRHDKSKRPTSQSIEVQSNAKLPDGTNFEIYKKKIDEQLAIVDPNVGVSESVRLKTAPVISFAKEFGEGKSGPYHDDNDLTVVPSTSKFDGQAWKRLALEMVKCAPEGYNNSLKGYAEAHVTPIMVNLAEALVRLDGVSKRASQTRKDVNEAVHVATQAGDYAWKVSKAVRLEQRGIEEALNKENLELKISHANIVQANQELLARCEGHEQRYLASTILCVEQSQRIRELEDKMKAARRGKKNYQTERIVRDRSWSLSTK